MEKNISLDERIFIAGSTGMVGKALKRSFQNKGYGRPENNGELLTPTRKELNLLDSNQVEKWFAANKPTIVVLAAAKVGGIKANKTKPAEFILDNLKIQTNVIEVAFRMGVKRFLFLGSSCIYPKYAEQPIQEESLLTNSLEPTNQWYAIAKIAGIKLCEALRSQYKFDAISLMPTNLYGPGDNYHPENSHVMAALIRKFYLAKKHSLSSVECWGSGSPFREFLHVDDLATAAIFVLENWDPGAKNAPLDKFGLPLQILNVGTGKEISIKDLANKISKLVGFQGSIKWDSTKPDGTPRKLLNISKIQGLGWHPEINLEDGIISTINLLENEDNFKKYIYLK